MTIIFRIVIVRIGYKMNDLIVINLKLLVVKRLSGIHVLVTLLKLLSIVLNSIVA